MTLSGSLSAVPSVRTLPVAGAALFSVTLLVLLVATGGSLVAMSVMVPLTLTCSAEGPPALPPVCTLLPSLSATV